MKKLIVLAAAAASTLLIGCSTTDTGTGGTAYQGTYMQNGAAASRGGDIGSSIGGSPSAIAPFQGVSPTVAPSSGTH
jgi:hypothetical protein